MGDLWLTNEVDKKKKFKIFLLFFTYFLAFLFDKFLVASTQHYERVCPSVCGSAAPSVTLSLETRRRATYGREYKLVCFSEGFCYFSAA